MTTNTITFASLVATPAPATGFTTAIESAYIIARGDVARHLDEALRSANLNAYVFLKNAELHLTEAEDASRRGFPHAAILSLQEAAISMKDRQVVRFIARHAA